MRVCFFSARFCIARRKTQTATARAESNPKHTHTHNMPLVSPTSSTGRALTPKNTQIPRENGNGAHHGVHHSRMMDLRATTGAHIRWKHHQHQHQRHRRLRRRRRCLRRHVRSIHLANSCAFFARCLRLRLRRRLCATRQYIIELYVSHVRACARCASRRRYCQYVYVPYTILYYIYINI